jgi:2-methylisocitrate lyase-like PEP mutase family enzyme
MPTKTTPTRRLRELVQEPRIVRMLGAHDVLGAVLVEQAGFESVFIGGFGTSASMLGLPDVFNVSYKGRLLCCFLQSSRWLRL